MTVELEVLGLGRRLGGRVVLHDLGFQTGVGVTALVGRNGAGKTTLMRVLSGSLAPHAGTVRRHGRDIYRDGPTTTWHRQTLGWLPQEPGLPPRMSVREVLAYAAWLKRLPAGLIADEVGDVADAVDLGELLDTRLGALSGGQRRRASLAAALIGGPEFLLLDEPTNGLDPVQREQFLMQVRRLGESRCVVLSTHLLEDVALVADRWVALDGGGAVAQGEVDRTSDEGLMSTVGEIRSAITAGSGPRTREGDEH